MQKVDLKDVERRNLTRHKPNLYQSRCPFNIVANLVDQLPFNASHCELMFLNNFWKCHCVNDLNEILIKC